MDKQVEKIRDALSRIPGNTDLEDESEIGKALEDINSSLELLKGHPHAEKIRAALAKTAIQLDEENGSDDDLTSKLLHRLSEELNECEEAHPGATLLISRLANAFAVYGL